MRSKQWLQWIVILFSTVAGIGVPSWLDEDNGIKAEKAITRYVGGKVIISDF